MSTREVEEGHRRSIAIYAPIIYTAIWGPKKSRFPGPKPLPLAQVMDMHASKTLCTGLYKSYVHRWFYVKEPTREVSGPHYGGGGGGGGGPPPRPETNSTPRLGPHRGIKKIKPPARPPPPPPPRYNSTPNLTPQRKPRLTRAFKGNKCKVLPTAICAQST